MAEVSDPQRAFSSSLLSQYRGRTLRRGNKSKTTRALQLFLREQGYDIRADGDYGKETEAAVRKWQTANGLTADGQAGTRTLTKMREKITPTPKERPTAIPRGDFAGSLEGPARVRPKPSFTEEAKPARRVPPIGGMGMPTASGAAGAPPGGSQVLPTGPVPELAAAAPPPPFQAGIGANEASRQIGLQEMSQGGELVPEVMSESWPVGAGGGRPNPTARPLDRQVTPPPFPAGRPEGPVAPMPPPEMAEASPYDDPSRQFDEPPPFTQMAEALAAGGGIEQGIEPPESEPISMPPPGFEEPPLEEAGAAAQIPAMGDMGGQFPMTLSDDPGLLPLYDQPIPAPEGEMTPQMVAMIKALLQGPNQSYTPGQAGY